MDLVQGANEGRGSNKASEDPSAGISQRKEHLRYLDALRGFAALAVIMVHCCIMADLGGLAGKLAWGGQRGVQLFYVISAFTLCYSFDLRRNDEKHPLRNYFIRRFFRIAPLFYVAVFLNLFVQGLAPRADAPDGLTPFDIILGLLFLNGFHPNTINSIAIGGWSIAVETTFYLVLPWILSFVRTLEQSFFLLTISAPCAFLLSHGCAHFSPDNFTREYFLFFWFPVEFPVFALGIFAYFLWKTFLRGIEVRRPKLLSWVLIAYFLIIFWLTLPIDNARLYWSSSSFVLLLLGLSICEWRLLVNPVTVFLGKISYSIYLSQFFFLLALPHVRHFAKPWLPFDPRRHDLLFVLCFLFVALASIAVSTVTYYFIERPGIHVGGKLIRKWEQKPVSERI